MNRLQRIPRTQLLAAIAVIILVAELFANAIDVGNTDAEESSVGGWLGLSAFGIAVTALLLFVVLPRIDAASLRTAAMVFAVLALVTNVVFWSALPFAFGAAGLAASAPVAAQPGSDNVPAAALSALAIVAGFVFCVIG